MGQGADPANHQALPYLVPLPTPSTAHRFWDAEVGADGWVFAAENALCLPDGTQWTPPDELCVAVPLPSGEIVLGGRGFCSLYRDGVEHRLLSQGSFTSGTGVGDIAVVACNQGAWAIGRNGLVDHLPFSGVGKANTFAWKGGLYVHAPRDGTFAFRNGHFERCRTGEIEANWVAVDGNGPAYLVDTGSGLLVVSTERANPLRFSPGLWARLYSEGIVGTAFRDRGIAVATFTGGLYGFNVADGQITGEAFHRFPDQLGGAPFFLHWRGAHLLLGTSSQVFVVSDPQIYAAAPLQTGGELFGAAEIQGKTWLISPEGVCDLTGNPIPAQRGVISATQALGGLVVARQLHLFLPSGRVIDLPNLDAPTIVPTGADVAVLTGLAVIRVTPAGTVTPVPGPDASSLAPAEGGPLVGTSRGVYRLTDGAVIYAFGSGPSRVAAVSRWDAVALDGQGTLFDSAGRVLASVPGARLVAASRWNGTVIALLELGQERFVLGEAVKGEWIPLEFPIPDDPARVVTEGGRLFVVGTRMAVSASRLTPAEPLPIVPHLPTGNEPVPDPWVLGKHEDGVAFILPPNFLPWDSPIYSVRSSDRDQGEWMVAAPGRRVDLPRLPFGRTQIEIRGDLGGKRVQTRFVVERPTPWWHQSPTELIFGVLTTILGAYAFVRWRTRHLSKRARALEALVAERTAELRKAQAAREEFLSSVSHEIRNPLNGVLGLCDMLDEALANPDRTVAARGRMLTKTLKGCGVQLRQILDDVLDFGKIDRGEIQVNEETFDLVDAIEGASRAVDPDLQKCRLDFAGLDAATRELWLRGDSGKIRQVVTNLVSNGLKYGSPPMVWIKASATPQVDGAVAVAIAVANTGPTIPPDTLEHLFESFVRGQDALARRIPGTGLGLAVSRRLVEAMRGSLTATSHDGLTTFRIEVVLGSSESPRTEAPPKFVEPNAKRSRALAIEDETYNRLVLGHILNQLGYEVDWAVDGAGAMELAKTGSYDLILTDFLLPDTDGATLAKQMLALFAEPKPPIIAVTAFSTTEKIAEAKAAGITGYVTKPISRQKLEAAILGLENQGFRSNPTMAVGESGDWDFSTLLRLPDGRQALAEFSAGLLPAWQSVEGAIAGAADDPETAAAAARAVHSFRSRVLAVHAKDLAEQLAIVERLVRTGRKPEDDLRRLQSLIGPLVQRLTDAGVHAAGA
jgi:signal transduction histidine kinase/CheY-like chemotaxis protein